MSVNKFIGIGFVGQEPTINKTNDGKEIANFSLAMSESWKNKAGEKQEKTEWIKVVAFGNLAGIVKNYVKKGSKLYIEGQLQTRKWTDDKGIERYTTEIVLNGFSAKIELLNKVEDSEISQHSKDKGNGYQQQVEESDDSSEIPF